MEITQAILLRTLSKKSTLKFGKFHDIPIWKMLDGFHTKMYLVWVYYNCSMVSFLPEILDELRIGEDDRIQKPATDKAKHDEIVIRVRKWFFAVQGFKATGNSKRARKNADNKTKRRAHKSKGTLQAKNHSK